MRKGISGVPVELEEEQKAALVRWLRSRQEKGDFAWIDGPRELRRLVDDCLAWHAAKGNPGRYHDWVAVCRRWIIKADELHFAAAHRGRREAYADLERPLARLRIVK